MQILAYHLIINHWHVVVWPKGDGDVSRLTVWITLIHTQHWLAHHGSAGSGYVYQGGSKSFPLQQDHHFLTACRYEERNASRAVLARRPEGWRWFSFWRYRYAHGQEEGLLSEQTVPRPRQWVAHVNRSQTEADIQDIRRCIQRSRPFGGKQ